MDEERRSRGSGRMDQGTHTEYVTPQEALANLEQAANQVLKSAEGTLGGVGFACFNSWPEQDAAFTRAKAKLQSAKELVRIVAKFKEEHGDFN